MSTTDRILDVATAAFNRLGSHAVTTNDLADELGMSVGNLYYHYGSKEEIIRAVFEKLDNAWRTRLVVASPTPGWADVSALIAEHFSVLWEFRFFYREQAALRQRDPKLAKKWIEVHRRGREQMKQLLTLLCQTEKPSARPSDADLEHATDVCWVLADYWLPYMESLGRKLKKSDLTAGVQFFHRAIVPLVRSLVSSPVNTHAEVKHAG